MTGIEAPEVTSLFRAACRQPMARPVPEHGPILDRDGVQGVLPHRDPFLLIDRVTLIDRERRLIGGSYDLAKAAPVFAGHFPEAPVWPGVLQVEAVAQAGLLLARYLAPDGEVEAKSALTQILGAQFLKPITPGGEVEIVAHVVQDGLFVIVVGQCLRNGEVCSAAAVRGL